MKGNLRISYISFLIVFDETRDSNFKGKEFHSYVTYMQIFCIVVKENFSNISNNKFE